MPCPGLGHRVGPARAWCRAPPTLTGNPRMVLSKKWGRRGWCNRRVSCKAAPMVSPSAALRTQLCLCLCLCFTATGPPSPLAQGCPPSSAVLLAPVGAVASPARTSSAASFCKCRSRCKTGKRLPGQGQWQSQRSQLPLARSPPRRRGVGLPGGSPPVRDVFPGSPRTLAASTSWVC